MILNTGGEKTTQNNNKNKTTPPQTATKNKQTNKNDYKQCFPAAAMKEKN